MPELQRLVAQARKRIGTVVYGADEAIRLLFVALGAGGHVLIEGVPGVGKTTIAKAFADVTGLRFNRIQLTPDLMPSDIVGHTYFDQKEQAFKVRKGPVFTNVLLADELNRTPPRTQSALLEVMQEGSVSLEGRTMAVPQPFFVVATKNPIEVEGVYPLPEAERDRFMMELRIGYPDRDVEGRMLAGKLQATGSVGGIPGLTEAIREGTAQVDVHPDVRDYILDVVRATREHPLLDYGASPRATEHLQQAARSHAALEGRDFVVPDDIKFLAPYVLRHRLILTADAEVQEADVDAIMQSVLDRVPVPIR